MAKKNAIIKKKIENVLYELMIKTGVDNVWIDDSTTLAGKLSEMITAINEKAKSTDVTNSIKTAIDNLRSELMGEGVPEAYDTFKELADYIESHQTAADALTAAVGNKVDKVSGKGLSTNDYTTAEKNKLNGIAAGSQANVIESISVNGTKQTPSGKNVNIVVPTGALASKSKVAESDLDTALKEKVNAASEGNHSHANKAVLDTITQDKVNSWDGKATVTVSSTDATAAQIAAMKNGDLFIQLV